MSLLPHLNLTTSFVFSAVAQIAIALGVYAIIRAQKAYAGFDRWTSGFLAAALGFALFANLGPEISHTGRLLANLGLMASVALQNDGLLLFIAPPRQVMLQRVNGVLFMIWFGLFVVADTELHSPDLSVAAFSGVFVTGAALAAWTILRSGKIEAMPALKILAAGYAIEALLHLARGTMTLTVGGAEPLVSSTDALSFGALIMSVILIMKGFGLVALNGQRLQQEWQTIRLDLEHLALTDHLTKLGNRRAFLEQGHALFGFAKRHNRSIAALQLDIDNFKQVNDTYGHQMGDLILMQVADTMKATLRHSDVIGRLGGEEFGVLLMETNRFCAELTAERIRRAVASMEPPLNGPRQITVSIGVATLDILDVADLQSLLGRADEALYQAKHGGRNQWAVAI